MTKVKILILASILICAYLWGVNYMKVTAQNISSISEQADAKWKPLLKNELAEKKLKLGAPVFLRIVKSTSINDQTGYLEAFVQSDNEGFVFFKRWPICTYSGALGPKLEEGDGQSPEGFYFVKPSAMNPNSSYHLSFNLGFPNAYDRRLGRTGSYLMVHGDCVSIGCYAMTNEGIEEIYTLMRAAFEGGQSFIRVHSFPFPMSLENMKVYKDHKDIVFWQNLKEGWEWFEGNKRPPNVEVENRRYVFN